MRLCLTTCLRPVVFLAHHHRLTAVLVAMLTAEVILSKVLT